MKKQTAVQYLVKQYFASADPLNYRHLKKALEIERQQIMKAYDSGFILCHEISLFVGVQENDLQGQAEHYYTQTFTEPKND